MEKLTTVREIVDNDYRTADVFRKWNINYCCGGTSTLAEACLSQQLDQALIEKELQIVSKKINISNQLDFQHWPLEFLVDYIVYIHHEYLKKVLPSLKEHISSYVPGHLKKYPHLQKVMEVSIDLIEELMEHTKHEEEIIFPYLKQINNTFNRKEVYGSLFVRTLRKPLNEMVVRQHNRIQSLLIELRKATNNYLAPETACTNHKVIYFKLKELDEDLVQHKLLENDFLIPRALEMEKELLLL